MRIAMFTNNYLPNPYGVSTSVDGFRRQLEELGHEVYVFAPEWGDAITDHQAHIYRYRAVEIPTKVPFALAVPYSLSIDEMIEEMDFDVIHAHHPNILGAHAERWARKKSVPLVFTWHTLYDRYVHYVPFLPERLSGWWVMQNALRFANRADHVIFPTESVHAYVAEKGFTNTHVAVIPSGVDEDLFADPSPGDVRQQHNIPHDARLLVSISRFTDEKNVIFLVKAMRRVLENNPNAYLLFGGEGNLLPQMQKILGGDDIKNRVIFPGRIARSEIKNYLRAADLFVYASTSETQGTIVTEAMYSGTPVVAVRAGGVEDIVVDGETGVLVGESVSDFSYAVRKILRENDVLCDFSGNAAKLAKEKYTAQACTELLLEVYTEVIAQYRER